MGKRNRDAAPRGRRQVLQLDRAPARAPWEVEVEEEQAPTPQQPQWQEVKEEGSGDVYYWNILTGATTWERPAELDAQLAGPAITATTNTEEDVDDVDDVLGQLEKEADAAPKPQQASTRPPAADGSGSEAKKDAGNALSLMGGYDSDSDEDEDAVTQDATTEEKGESEKMEVEGEQVSAQEGDTAELGDVAESVPSSMKEQDGEAEKAEEAGDAEEAAKEAEEVVKKPVSFTVVAKEKPKGDVTEARAALKALQAKSPNQVKLTQEDGAPEGGEGGAKEPDDGDVDDFLRELEGDGTGEGEEEKTTDGAQDGDIQTEGGKDQASAFQKPAAVASAFQKPAPVAKLQRSLSPPSEEEKEDGELDAGEELETEESKRAEAGRVEEEDRRVLEESFHTVLALREEGEVLVSRLKASVAEEAAAAGGGVMCC